MAAKQVVVVRRDLEMPEGKLGSQVAHASLGAIQMMMKRTLELNGYDFTLFVEDNTALGEWWLQAETTIVLGTHPKREKHGDHLQQLLDLQAAAEAKGLPTKLVVDNGTTVFAGVKTPTCLGIGPGFLDDFIGITDHLRPY